MDKLNKNINLEIDNDILNNIPLIDSKIKSIDMENQKLYLENGNVIDLKESDGLFMELI